ncbi:MAG: elongation factor G [Bacteroidales bacterium]|nr:elongation factor G [Bacteroidales bacterium]MDD2322661.1 elongation factor G [Bacteroidales bacterium]MDD3010744.1 elongation factor G [Bacteroidales bacterium]MDD3961804.1 elongation factor G [Bacteroidales bacterium]HPE87563.1 elongation factor G [Bacteroidales bacterium]
MKVYQTNDVRNVALIGGAKTGKTTLAESMAFYGGVISRKGSVEDKNSISDYREIELARQNSVSSTVLYSEYKDKKINIIDNPGFNDYIGEVYASMRVCETAIMLVSAQNGVEVGTEINFRAAQTVNQPLVFLINGLDHEKAKFDEVVRELKEYFGNKLIIAQYPVNAGQGFDSIIDLLDMKMYKYPKGGGKPSIEDIPAEEADKAEELQAALIEAAAEGDDSLMEKFFEEGTLSADEISHGLKLGITSCGVYPILCTSAKEDIGVDTLMNFIITTCPAPGEASEEITTKEVKLNCKPNDPTTAFIFKTSIESHLGEVVYFKVMGGTIEEGQDLINAKNESKERIPQLLVVAGKNREKVAKIMAGDFGATIKLKETRTNDTLVVPKSNTGRIQPIYKPEPIFWTAIKAVNSSDDEKLGLALNEMHKIDPTLGVEYSRELKQQIVSGLGEVHINTMKWYLANQYKIDIELFAPKVPYRETITKIANASYRHKKQSGGAGQFGEVHLRIQPYVENYAKPTDFPVRDSQEYVLDWGGKLIFNNCIVGGSIDARFLPAILKGIMERIETGPLTGSYARDIVVYVYDGKMHPVDSNEISFKLAGKYSFADAFRNAGPKIMEPVYDVEVLVPEELMGGVMTDLQNRRAIVMGMDPDGKYQKIRAQVPLGEMNRYSTTLSSLTSGRATYTMKFNEYRQVPGDVQDRLLKEYADQQADEE